MSTSMVKGNPLKLMLHFALPLLIGNLLQQTYNIIDAAIVGQILGAKALASVGASSSVQFLVLGFCMGSCTGFGVPVAKYFGGNNLEKMRDYIFNGAVLVGIIAAVVTTICAVFCPQILHLLSVPEDIFDGAYAYLIIFLDSFYPDVQLSLRYSPFRGRQPDTLYVPGLFRLSEYFPGSFLHRGAEMGLRGSCHRNDSFPGHQRFPLPGLYH